MIYFGKRSCTGQEACTPGEKGGGIGHVEPLADIGEQKQPKKRAGKTFMNCRISARRIKAPDRRQRK